MLCGPGGRLSGTPEAHRAARFLAGKLADCGLGSIHLETFDMPGWRVEKTIVTLLGDPPATLAGAVALCNTQSTPPDGITAELVDAGEGTAEEFARLGDTLRSRFALVADGGERRAQKMRLALDRGAAGLVVRSAAGRAPIIGSCHETPRPEPGLVIRAEDGERLVALLKNGAPVRLNVQIEAQVWDAHPENIVAEIPGTGSAAGEIVILCAHLDSWHLAEGAIDNGSGSAAILEAARALAALGWQPRRTVRFIWFQGEEQHLYGSRAYVRAHADELRHVTAVVNVDMPGSPRSLATSGGPEFVEFLQGWRAGLRGYELSPEIGKLAGNFSDHGPFVEAGVTCVALWGEHGPGVSSYHTAGDTYDKVDRRATVQSAAVLATLVRHLADRP
jgi:hypothetical protein